MSSITAQQTKLDLELVPKENKLDIGKCNGIIPRGLTPREPTFQVVLDAIALTPCYPAAMAKEDAFLVDYFKGGLCVDNTDAGIVGRCNSGSNKDKGKELWDSLESKYMAEDSSSKKFLVSNFNNYKMVDSRPVMEQYNELLRILGQYTQHGLKMDESISVSSIIDKLPPSWKDFKHTLKHGKDDLSLVQLGSHLRIEESLRAQDIDKGKGKEVGGPSVNMTEEGKNKHNKQNKGKKRSNENKSSSSSNKKPKLECWKCGKTGHFKRDCRSGKKNNANAGGSGKGSKDQSQDQGQNLVNIWNSFVKYSVSLISEAFFVQVDAIAWWIDSGAITHICKDRCWRIIHETASFLYTPQQNGVAERKNRALKENDKFMLSLLSLRLSKAYGPNRTLWGEKGIDCNFVGYVSIPMHIEIGTQVLSSRGQDLNGTTYVNMKLAASRSFGLSFLKFSINGLRTQGLCKVQDK
ncbi:zinc finger, CCHC-type containing protein [Tanacetum coccineum]